MIYQKETIYLPAKEGRDGNRLDAGDQFTHAIVTAITGYGEFKMMVKLNEDPKKIAKLFKGDPEDEELLEDVIEVQTRLKRMNKASLDLQAFINSK